MTDEMLNKLTRFEIDQTFRDFPPPLLRPYGELTLEDFDTITGKGGFMWLVGSRSIRHAATPDSDYDFLVISRRRMPGVFSSIGCKLDTGGDYDPNEGSFNSWRKGRVNFIATDKTLFAKRFLAANEAVKHLGLLRRSERVVVFEAVLNCKPPSNSKAKRQTAND